ncbi:TldD/PmbA family protein [Roseivivax sediminis]|uniref:PmbA protein n=1 Tax=Roseivivax sediminis TaxID=936889 RepID=A0A1I1ZNS4_9RHOB|nr:metallopeptidase TldD-related protein [Roseivivax sediminis]SFE33339.1 microcin-processing peptidase 1. Unknown type peptidase. MEROPS family U62 [Roseivivax sediminis]
MSHDLSALTQALLDAARRAGADSADALASAGTSVGIDVRAGKLEEAERAERTEIGLRVFTGRRGAVVSGSDLRPEAMTAMAERAVAMARVAPEDPFAGLADPSELAATWDAAALDLWDPAPEPDPAALEDAARRAEAAALAADGITRIDSASSSYSATEMHLAATNGFSGGYRRTATSVGCTAIAGDGTGMERDHDGDTRTHGADLRTPEEIGATAAARTLQRMNPRRPKTGAYPVVFHERVAASLIGHLLAAASGSAVARGASWLRDALGAEVLPSHLSLTEDPHRPRTLGSRPFDAEGLATRPRDIVASGILQSYTLDLAAARKLSLTPTANAARSLSSGPSPSPWNVALTQGSQSLDDLLSEMGTGLLVTDLIGATINPNTGDYSRGASGLWIEGGIPQYPVSGVTIAGALPQMLRTIAPANDARPWLSRVVPSLRLEGLTLAGD